MVAFARLVQTACAVAVGLAMLAAEARPVAASFGGIFGFSGRNGTTCSPTCHVDGVAPDVAFEAPQGTQMLAGAIATFRFRITSNDPSRQTHAGFDVAPSSGTIGVVDEVGTRTIPGLIDIVHTMPRENDGNGVAVFDFSWEAPMTPGIYTLFGAGNSVNFDDTLGGDFASATTLEIEVIAAPTATATVELPTPTASEAPTPTASEPPTPSPTSGTVCTGDCDGGGSVTVDEIVRGVTIALGDRPIDDCPPFDRDGGGSVTVDEIVEAIGNALEGCG